jgi:vacuolar iron transporter family protein
MKFSIENFVFGVTNLLADGFSMSIGNYLATKTRDEYVSKEKEREEWEIENMVEQKKEEIRDIYARKDFKDELLEDIVSIITKKRSVWVDTTMREELGLIESKGRALDNALGLIPLVLQFSSHHELLRLGVVNVK